MFWIRTWILGVKSLLLHPMRSVLTVLGILFGVASVIWLVAIGEGISQQAQKQIEGLGADNIIVRSIKPPAEARSGFRGPMPYGLKRAEFDKLIETIPTIKSALPIREVRRRIYYGDRDPVDGRLVGCTPEYAGVTQLKVSRGRFLSEGDLRHKHNHCVLAARLTETLFPYEDPIGRSIYLAEHQDYYKIVGVLRHRSPTAAIGGSLSAQDFSKDVYIPISTLRQLVGDFVVRRGSSTFEAEVVELNQITLRIDKIENVRATADLVRLTLGLEEEGDGDGDGEKSAAGDDGQSARRGRSDVDLVVPDELLRQARITRLMFMFFMGLIAAISLLVGGIGIMNIMLATVTERTREIGIRRALGATRTHIIAQFLIETISLSVVGGLIGVAMGMLGPRGFVIFRDTFSSLRPDMVAHLPEVVRTVEPIIVPESIPIAFCISVAVGIVFGIYPAIRASMMDPIEALRHE